MLLEYSRSGAGFEVPPTPNGSAFYVTLRAPSSTVTLNSGSQLEGALIADRLTRNGFPALGEQFQTNLPRLFITTMAANQDFGPFFGFTMRCRHRRRAHTELPRRGNLVHFVYRP